MKKSILFQFAIMVLFAGTASTSLEAMSLPQLKNVVYSKWRGSYARRALSRINRCVLKRGVCRPGEMAQAQTEAAALGLVGTVAAAGAGALGWRYSPRMRDSLFKKYSSSGGKPVEKLALKKMKSLDDELSLYLEHCLLDSPAVGNEGLPSQEVYNKLQEYLKSKIEGITVSAEAIEKLSNDSKYRAKQINNPENTFCILYKIQEKPSMIRYVKGSGHNVEIVKWTSYAYQGREGNWYAWGIPMGELVKDGNQTKYRQNNKKEQNEKEVLSLYPLDKCYFIPKKEIEKLSIPEITLKETKKFEISDD